MAITLRQALAPGSPADRPGDTCPIAALKDLVGSITELSLPTENIITGLWAVATASRMILIDPASSCFIPPFVLRHLNGSGFRGCEGRENRAGMSRVADPTQQVSTPWPFRLGPKLAHTSSL